MAQYACTGLKKRQILVAMFLTIFIGLLEVGVIIPIAAYVVFAVGATATLFAWAMFRVLCMHNSACAGVTASP